MSEMTNPQAVICVANEGNEVSLQLWRVYKTLRDDDARSEGLIRIVDETGEDYLFPHQNFAPIELPKEIQKPFERAVRQQRREAASPRKSVSVKTARVGSRVASQKRSTRPGRLTSR
jgi:hypothetical protein